MRVEITVTDDLGHTLSERTVYPDAFDVDMWREMHDAIAAIAADLDIDTSYEC